MVRGFDEGISKTKVGEKATVICPSRLANDDLKQGSIPINSPLTFGVYFLEKNREDTIAKKNIDNF